MQHSPQDVEEYKKEWTYWIGGTLIFIAIYVFLGLRNHNFGFFWPLVPPAIWALILVVAPIFSSGDKE